MKIKNCFKGLLAISLILSILFIIPIFALDPVGNQKIALQYNDIEKRVLEDNLQLKATRVSVNKLKSQDDDADDDVQDIVNAVAAQVYIIEGLMNDMDAIINKSESDPTMADIAKIAKATKSILKSTFNNLKSQTDSLDDGADAISDQLKAAQLGLEQAEITLVNTTQNMFVLYHQLTDNLAQMKISRAQLSNQLDLVNKNIELGLAAKIAAVDLKTSLLELDASTTALDHQRDSLLLQMKGLLGLTYKDELSLGELPSVDRNSIYSVDLGKDIEMAVENSLSIKSKEVELSNSSIVGTRRKYELQLKENESVLNFTKKYYTLIETRDNLLVSENKLNAAKLKLEQGQNKYDKGQISQIELSTLQSDVESQKFAVESNMASLFCEMENYRAMKAGML